MKSRYLAAGVLIGGIFIAAGCSSSSSDGTGKKYGKAVGTPCTDSSQCSGYDHPSCITELKPIEPYVTADAGAAGDKYKNFTIPFPGGYCGTALTDSCASDAECGAGAGCFRGFEGVDAQTIQNLNQLGLPFDVTKFADLGICFQSCQTDADCRTSEGYKCVVPLHALINIVNPNYTKTYCIQDVDTSDLIVGGGSDGG